ncbi:hypothetical protein CHUAL_000364 [Chamberlinius hualienensis]
MRLTRLPDMKIYLASDLINLLLVYLFCTVGVHSESRIETNWTIVSQSDGTIYLNWSIPSDGNGQSSILNVDQYVLSWTFRNGRNETISSNITTTYTNASIANSYLGATYTLILYCQMQDVIVTCKNQTLTAYPPCPFNWKQKETNCFYFSEEAKTWRDSKKTCEDIWSGKISTQDISDEEVKKLIKDNSNLWTVLDPCAQLSQEDVSRRNCCTSNIDQSRPFTVCPADTVLPFICQADAEFKAAKLTNISIASYTNNNSAIVSWTEIRDGWNLLWRTITVYNEIGTLLSTSVIPGQNKHVELPPLEPGLTYKVKLWPHKNGKLRYTEDLSFALLKPRSSSETNGGVLQLPLSINATVNWDGMIRVRWKPAMANKVNTLPFSADGYRLAYGLENENSSNFIEINVTSDNFYDISEFHANQTYRVNVDCIFGEQVLVPCGKITQLFINTPSKIIHDGNKFKVYNIFNESISKTTWTAAESSCVQINGHLVSVNGVNDDNQIGAMLQETPYWIGANNCHSNSSLKWTDGSTSNYSKIQNMIPDNDSCCVSINYDQNSLSNWDYTDCNSILPYICLSTVDDMGILQNLSIISSTSTTFRVHWKTTNRLISVSSYSAEVCKLNATVCSVTAVNVTSSPIYLRSLEPDTQYVIRINATINNQSLTISANTTAKTGNGKMRDVSVNVTSDGQVLLEWSNLNMSNSKDIVYVVSSDSNNTKFPFKTRISNSTQMNITGIPYGETYNLKLLIIENGTDHILDTISFTVTSKPNCSREEFQFESSCYWIWKEEVTWDEGTAVCQNGGGQLALTSSSEKTNFFREIALLADTPLWVEGKTSALLIKSKDTEILIDQKRVKRSAGCRVIKNTDEDQVAVDQCVKRFPVLCERKIAVLLSSLSDLIIKDITTSSITLQWQITSWKPSNYTIDVNSVAPTNRSKRDTASQPIIAVGNDVATISGLQPNTEYNVGITPTLDAGGNTPNKIVGDTKTVNVQTLDPRSETAPRALGLTGGQMDTSSIANSPLDNGTRSGIDDGTSARNEKLWVFRIISCSVLIGLVTLSILIFTFCGMLKYRDCVCEVCFEISLLVVHILILVDIRTFNEMDCRIAAICIHYFFTTCFFFFALECFCHVKTMTKMIPIGFLIHGWQYFLIGWGVPIIIVIITSTTVGDLYVLREIDHYCWLNLDGDAMLGTVIPVGTFAGLAFLTICLSICARPEENYEVDEESFTRYEPMQDLRWMLLFIVGLLISHWAVGIVGTHEQDGNLYIAFIVLNIVLGIAILLLRCVGDDEIRLRIRTCCKSTPVEPVDKERNRYLSSQLDLKNKKGLFQSAGPESDGTLILRRTYIYRP